jgi:uncharacterized protein (DUF488 family)
LYHPHAFYGVETIFCCGVMTAIYTLGYGGRGLEDFVEILERNVIDVLVDVRRFPKSRCPGFSKDDLEVRLTENEVRYVFMGDTLGGFRRGGYEKYTGTAEYERGINDLLELAHHGRVAIMCKERSPRGCHRRYISETLRERGIEVVDI